MSSQIFGQIRSRAPALRIAALIPSSRQFLSTSRLAEKEDVFTKLLPGDLAPKFKHRIAERKFLPGSHGKGLPEYLAPPREGLPYALSAGNINTSLDQWTQLCQEQLDKALPAYGVVLFRNLPLYKAEDFAQFTAGLRYTPTSYEGGTGNRDVFAGDVYFSTNDPPSFSIELHNEMACSTVYPKKVCFKSSLPSSLCLSLSLSLSLSPLSLSLLLSLPRLSLSLARALSLSLSFSLSLFEVIRDLFLL